MFRTDSCLLKWPPAQAHFSFSCVSVCVWSRPISMAMLTIEATWLRHRGRGGQSWGPIGDGGCGAGPGTYIIQRHSSRGPELDTEAEWRGQIEKYPRSNARARTTNKDEWTFLQDVCKSLPFRLILFHFPLVLYHKKIKYKMIKLRPAQIINIKYCSERDRGLAQCWSIKGLLPS